MGNQIYALSTTPLPKGPTNVVYPPANVKYNALMCAAAHDI